MNPYNVTGPTATEVAQVESIVSQRLKGSFLWMVVGLLTTMVLEWPRWQTLIGYALRTKTLVLSY